MAFKSGTTSSSLEDAKGGERTSRLNAKKQLERRRLAPESGSAPKAGDRLEGSKHLANVWSMEVGIRTFGAVLRGETLESELLHQGRVLHMDL